MGVVDRSQERGLIRISHIRCTGAFLAFRRRRTTQRITTAESFKSAMSVKQSADHRVGQQSTRVGEDQMVAVARQ